VFCGISGDLGSIWCILVFAGGFVRFGGVWVVCGDFWCFLGFSCYFVVLMGFAAFSEI